MRKKLIVIGLDCATPQFVFDQYRNDLPNLNKLMTEGIYTELESIIPPITVPAWMCMVTGKDPGQLGIYGFRNRKNYSYDRLAIANSSFVKEKTAWDRLSEKGKKVIVMGVPPTYPPKKVNGLMISGFLSPGTDADYTYPSELKKEISDVVGDYIIDVGQFRTDDKEKLKDQIFEMSEKRFKLASYLLQNKQWDYFMMVAMGPDRIHHGFWKFCDPDHPKFEPGNPFQDVIREYYMYLDSLIGNLVNSIGEDVSIMVVSDHGAKSMIGGICINEWLIKKGYLTVKNYPDSITQLDDLEIDWKNTKVWASGGYYARVFFNVCGREPDGVIPESEYDGFRKKLKEEIEEMIGPDGKKLNTEVYIPEEIYKQLNNIPPDLIVLFGNLDWRSVGSLGFKDIYTFENDTGPDDANHARHGIFILKTKELKKTGHIPSLKITDCAGIMIDLLGE